MDAFFTSVGNLGGILIMIGVVVLVLFVIWGVYALLKPKKEEAKLKADEERKLLDYLQQTIPMPDFDDHVLNQEKIQEEKKKIYLGRLPYGLAHERNQTQTAPELF